MDLVLGEEEYRLPPKDVVDIVDAPPEPSVSISPDHEWMLFVERDAMPSIEDLARPMLRLGGVRIDPSANSQFRTSFNRAISIRPLKGGDKQQVSFPEGTRISGINWSHKSTHFTVSTVDDMGMHLWVVDVKQPSNPTKLLTNINTVLAGYEWLPDGDGVICSVVPESRGAYPVQPKAPTGPNIQETSGNETPTRTYQDLLTNPYDEDLFEFFGKTQMVLAKFDGTKTNLGKPDLYRSFGMSPDGKYILVTIIRKPFSYLMPYRSFPHDVEVWDLNGNLVYTVAEVPLAENIPIEGVRTGPRSIDWKSTEPATLVWTEALDGGDPNQEAEHRDRLVSLAAPFSSEPQEMVKIQHRSFGITYFADPQKFMTTDYDRDRRWVRTLLFDMNNEQAGPKVLMDRSIRDRYGDPGQPLMDILDNGHAVVMQDGPYIYRTGRGASPKGDLPFMDRQNLDNLETERLWRCEEGVFQSVVAVPATSEDKKPSVITVKESTTTPPNFYWTDLESGATSTLTEFKDPTPQIRGIKKQLVKYERSDGVPLSATLYLPADYEPGTRLPLLVWAYPREFNDVATAGQISSSPSRFTRMGSISHLTLLTQGYAIMDAATMPVIGDPETMNDTFIEQIVDAAQAAIDKAVEMGVADPNRVAVGGHSYGAFMTANLLAHCDLFKAGLARSGAYNRTLTPFGFQSERRKLWDAKDVYYSISPFLHADKIKEPMLMIHGEADNNSGTFPVQSSRMYQAIKGNGGTARLVMLPYESHGYRARESVLHTQAEMIDWLDKHVKNASGSKP